MGKEDVLQEIREAAESFEAGTWTFPQLTKAILKALKYLIENL